MSTGCPLCSAAFAHGNDLTRRAEIYRKDMGAAAKQEIAALAKWVEDRERLPKELSAGGSGEAAGEIEPQRADDRGVADRPMEVLRQQRAANALTCGVGSLRACPGRRGEWSQARACFRYRTNQLDALFSYIGSFSCLV